jgi:hypothetical protein
MIPQRHVWDLVAKKLACSATTKELAELELLMQQDLALDCTVHVMEAIWKQPARNTTAEKMLDEQFKKHTKRLNDHLAEAGSRNG